MRGARADDDASDRLSAEIELEADEGADKEAKHEQQMRQVVAWFWELLEHEYTCQQRAALLQFCTGSSAPPALGFKHMNGEH